MSGIQSTSASEYKGLRLMMWGSGLILLGLGADLFFFERAFIKSFGLPSAVGPLLFTSMIFMTAVYLYDLKANKMGQVQLFSLVGIVGYNVVCLSWIFDIF